jgi:hypothetical protein
MVRVAVGLVPVQLPLPVKVNVAVKDPELTVGVKVARAGSAFCSQVPDPTPPVQVAALKLPVAAAPTRVMAANGVPSQRLIAGPAVVIAGDKPQLMVRVAVGLVPAQLPLPVSVRVAVNDPVLVVGVKVARAGFAFCAQVPRPPPPLHVAAL